MAAKQHRILPEGVMAPQHRLQLLDGGETPLYDSDADPLTLFVFFKVTCPVCQLTLPYLNDLHRSGSMKIRAVSQNSPEDTREFIEEFGIEYPVLLDKEDAGFPASNLYGISHVPSQFLVGKDARIARVIEGWNKQEMQKLGVQVEPGVPDFKAG